MLIISGCSSMVKLIRVIVVILLINIMDVLLILRIELNRKFFSGMVDFVVDRIKILVVRVMR